MLAIRFALPNLPKDGEIDITGLDVIFKNGHTYKISDEAAEAFRVRNSRPVVSAETGNTVYEPGPDLVEAFKANEYITVSEVKPQEGDDR